MKPLTVIEVEYTAHELAKRWMTWDEPIPSFNTRNPGVLESCLVTPFQTFGGKNPHKGLIGKASMLFYLMIKNHPFRNGNKRIAVVALLYFLYKNKKWIILDNTEFYNFAKWVAESNPRVKDATVQAVHKFIKTYIVNL